MTVRAVPTEAPFEVVWPLGAPAFQARSPNARVPDLRDKVIAETWDYLFRGEEIFPILREGLAARFPGIRFIPYDVFGNLHGPQQRELIARLPQLLREHSVDAVISAIGA
jgi:hypothetical protein